MTMHKICEVVITVPDLATAKEIAAGAISERLAACSQLDAPITSIYHWDRKIELSEEVRVHFKTSLELSTALIKWIELCHPYEVPMILAREWDSTEAYYRWIQEETQPPS